MLRPYLRFVLVLISLLISLSACGTSPRQAADSAPTMTTALTVTPALPPGNDWTQYRFDTMGTGVNPEHVITSANVPEIMPRWVACHLRRPLLRVHSRGI